jgi:hypothetical protein
MIKFIFKLTKWAIIAIIVVALFAPTILKANITAHAWYAPLPSAAVAWYPQYAEELSDPNYNTFTNFRELNFALIAPINETQTSTLVFDNNGRTFINGQSGMLSMTSLLRQTIIESYNTLINIYQPAEIEMRVTRATPYEQIAFFYTQQSVMGYAFNALQYQHPHITHSTLQMLDEATQTLTISLNLDSNIGTMLSYYDTKPVSFYLNPPYTQINAPMHNLFDITTKSIFLPNGLYNAIDAEAAGDIFEAVYMNRYFNATASNKTNLDENADIVEAAKQIFVSELVAHYNSAATRPINEDFLIVSYEIPVATGFNSYPEIISAAHIDYNEELNNYGIFEKATIDALYYAGIEIPAAPSGSTGGTSPLIAGATFALVIGFVLTLFKVAAIAGAAALIINAIGVERVQAALMPAVETFTRIILEPIKIAIETIAEIITDTILPTANTAFLSLAIFAALVLVLSFAFGSFGKLGKKRA